MVAKRTEEMAEIITVLGEAASVFETIIVNPDIDQRNQLSARELRSRITEKIHQLSVGPSWLEDKVKAEVYSYLHGVKAAVAATDYGEAVRQGGLMLDALPGEGQTGQKPPWEE
jgi:hypothetical protein